MHMKWCLKDVTGIPEIVCVFLPSHCFLPSFRRSHYFDFYCSLFFFWPEYVLNKKYRLVLHVFILYKWNRICYFVTSFVHHNVWDLFMIVARSICTFIVLAVLWLFLNSKFHILFWKFSEKITLFLSNFPFFEFFR